MTEAREQSDHLSNSEAHPKKGRWSWTRHPFFPVGLFALASLALEENYPFSEFSMYSNPTTRPLHYHYVTDGDGTELPILTHTRLSPSKVSKMFNRSCRKEDERTEKMPKGERPSRKERHAQAAYLTLEYMHRESMKLSKKRHLPDEIQLVEVSIIYGEDGFTEEKEIVAKYP